VWGRDGDTAWLPVFPEGSARLAFGAPDWNDFELSLAITPLAGGNAQVMFRLAPEGRRYYLLDLLLGWPAVAISRMDQTPAGHALRKLDVVNFPLHRGRASRVQIAARDGSLPSYVDDGLVNQVTDDALRGGRVALNMWQAQTRYRDLRYRVLA
jgi:hypothetical protein